MLQRLKTQRQLQALRGLGRQCLPKLSFLVSCSFSQFVDDTWLQNGLAYCVDQRSMPGTLTAKKRRTGRSFRL